MIKLKSENIPETTFDMVVHAFSQVDLISCNLEDFMQIKWMFDSQQFMECKNYRYFVANSKIFRELKAWINSIGLENSKEFLQSFELRSFVDEILLDRKDH